MLKHLVPSLERTVNRSDKPECIPSMAVTVLRLLTVLPKVFATPQHAHENVDFFFICFCFPSISFRSQRRADRRCKESCLPQPPGGSESVQERNNHRPRGARPHRLGSDCWMGPGPGSLREGGCSEQLSPPPPENCHGSGEDGGPRLVGAAPAPGGWRARARPRPEVTLGLRGGCRSSATGACLLPANFPSSPGRRPAPPPGLAEARGVLAAANCSCALPQAHAPSGVPDPRAPGGLRVPLGS